MKDQRTSTCPACGGPMRPLARVCQPCRDRNRCCKLCHAFEPGLIDGKCRECFRALDGVAAVRGSGRRPESFAFPPGHLERLATLAAAGLPLFGEGERSCS